jgi:hypothetical protein
MVVIRYGFVTEVYTQWAMMDKALSEFVVNITGQWAIEMVRGYKSSAIDVKESYDIQSKNNIQSNVDLRTPLHTYFRFTYYFFKRITLYTYSNSIYVLCFTYLNSIYVLQVC